jgi:hypothetical protein
MAPIANKLAQITLTYLSGAIMLYLIFAIQHLG